MSILPFKHEAKSPVSTVGEVVVAVNSCLMCGGVQTCRQCKGVGTVRFQLPNDPENRSFCTFCFGRGRCVFCHGHCEVLSEFVREVEDGSFGIAEACIQRELMRMAAEEHKERSGKGAWGAGIGLAVGSLVAPGLGTIVGLSLGKMLGDKAAEDQGCGEIDWRRADLLYCLGATYAIQDRKSEAYHAWVKALTLFPNHDASKNALRGTP